MPLPRPRSIGFCAKPSPIRSARNSWRHRHAASLRDGGAGWPDEISRREQNSNCCSMILLPRLSKALDRTTAPVRKSKANSEFNGPPLSGYYLRVVALVLGREIANGYDGASPVANSIRLYHHLPYHLSILHDRLGSLAHRPRSLVSCDRSSGLPRDLRILAEDIRRGVRIGCGVRHRDGIPVRHELERAVQNVRADPGPASDVRDLH